MNRILAKCCLVLLGLHLSSVGLDAAVVDWGEPITIGEDADIDANGTTIGAYNFGGVENPTVNEIGFTGIEPGTNYNNHESIFGSDIGPFLDLSPGYQTLLRSGSFQPGPVIFQFDDLIIGQKYAVQIWVNDSRVLAFKRTVTLSAGKSVTLAQNASGIEGGLGQTVVGTWIADEVSQEITVSSDSGIVINAYRLSY